MRLLINDVKLSLKKNDFKVIRQALINGMQTTASDKLRDKQPGKMLVDKKTGFVYLKG